MAFMQPLQYQSMFVPTNLGLMNQQLMKRDKEYEANEMAMANAADKYSQVISDPSAVEYKNQLLDQFGNDMRELTEQHGGDLGAIDKKALVNKINKIRPMIQDVEKHALAREDEKKRIAQLGPWADLQSGVGGYEEWASGDREYAKIGDTRDYDKFLEQNYSNKAKMRRDNNLVLDPTGQFYMKTTKHGITKSEEQFYTDKMYDDLKAIGVSDTVAMQKAAKHANNLVMGESDQYMRNANYVPDHKREAISDPNPSTIPGYSYSSDQKYSTNYNKQFGTGTGQIDLNKKYDQIEKTRSAIPQSSATAGGTLGLDERDKYNPNQKTSHTRQQEQIAEIDNYIDKYPSLFANLDLKNLDYNEAGAMVAEIKDNTATYQNQFLTFGNDITTINALDKTLKENKAVGSARVRNAETGEFSQITNLNKIDVPNEFQWFANDEIEDYSIHSINPKNGSIVMKHNSKGDARIVEYYPTNQAEKYGTTNEKLLTAVDKSDVVFSNNKTYPLFNATWLDPAWKKLPIVTAKVSDPASGAIVVRSAPVYPKDIERFKNDRAALERHLFENGYPQEKIMKNGLMEEVKTLGLTKETFGKE